MANAAPTFASLKTKISRRLIDMNNTAISVSEVGDAINDSIAFYKQKPFWFNQRRATLQLVQNCPFIMANGVVNPDYPTAPQLPADFLWEDEENAIVIPYSNLNYIVKKKHQRDYDIRNVAGIGIPEIYCWRVGNLEIYYFPNVAYKAYLYYYIEYAALANDNDFNDFTQYADKLIEYDAISRLLSDIRMDDPRAARFDARADKEYANLQARSTKQAATGELTTTSILD